MTMKTLMILGVAMTDQRSDALAVSGLTCGPIGGLLPRPARRYRPACLPGISAGLRGVLARARAACPPPATAATAWGIGLYSKPKNRAPFLAGVGMSLPRGKGRENHGAAMGARGTGEKICRPGYGAGDGRA